MKQTSPRIRKSAADRKAEIQQAALDLAFQVGPDNVSTGMIAAKLGLTQPALYKHYPRKQDIWRAIAEQLSHRVADNIVAAETGDTAPLARIRKLVLSHLDLIKSTPALPEIMVMRAGSDNHTVVQSAIQISITAYRAALTTAIVDAQTAGLFRAEIDPKDAEILIFGIIQSLVLRLMITRNTAILPKDGARLLELQLSGFAKPLGETS